MQAGWKQKFDCKNCFRILDQCFEHISESIVFLHPMDYLKQMNDSIWRNQGRTSDIVCEQVKSFWLEWENAQEIREKNAPQTRTNVVSSWKKPMNKSFKCKIDVGWDEKGRGGHRYRFYLFLGWDEKSHQNIRYDREKQQIQP